MSSPTTLSPEAEQPELKDTAATDAAAVQPDQASEAPVSKSQQVMDLEREYLLQNYGRYPLMLVRGKGCYLYSAEGKRYLDLISGIGVNALGHAHPRITKVLREQAGLLIHSSNLYYHEFQGKLAERLSKLTGLQRSFFCNSGAEAMEAALKMVKAHGAKIHPDKIEIVSLENSFHGRTIGALSVTGQPKYRKDFEPLMPGVKFVPVNDIAALEQMVCDRTAGILIEAVQGEGGIYPVSADFIRKSRELCDRYDALLIDDEIQCGVGRPGKHFAYQTLDPIVMPDVLVAAKPLAAGLPLGVLIANERAAKAIAPGMHGSTFGGGALSCRVSLEFFDILEELMPKMANVAAYFRVKLDELAHKNSVVKEVRSIGLMFGMELTHPCKQLVLDAMAEGLLINCTHDNVLRFLPPYILTEKQVDQAISVLGKILKKWKPE